MTYIFHLKVETKMYSDLAISNSGSNHDNTCLETIQYIVPRVSFEQTNFKWIVKQATFKNY